LFFDRGYLANQVFDTLQVGQAVFLGKNIGTDFYNDALVIERHCKQYGLSRQYYKIDREEGRIILK
jgi:hypothetical protein